MIKNCFMRLFSLLIIVIIPQLNLACSKQEQPPSDSTNIKRVNVPNSSFSFIQITDTHLKEEEHYKRMERVIDTINNFPTKHDFVIHTGDIMMDNIMDQIAVKRVKKLFSKLLIPIHFVAGNHDILKSSPQITKKQFEIQFGPISKTFLHKKVRFLLLYTEPLPGRITLKNYSPFSTMAKLLKNKSKYPVLLFHHAPSSPDFYKNRFHSSWSKSTKEKWINHLVKYNVHGVFAGHFHRDELQSVGSIPLYIAPPIAGYWGRQASFRTYHYKNGRITYRTHYVN
jgi:predicted phosphodiesterase